MKHRKTLMEQATTPLREQLDNAGLDADFLIEKLKQELDAKEIKPFCTKEGDVVYSDEMVAWDIRQRARKDAHELRGDYPPKKKEVSGAKGGPLEMVMDFGDSESESEEE